MNVNINKNYIFVLYILYIKSKLMNINKRRYCNTCLQLKKKKK